MRGSLRVGADDGQRIRRRRAAAHPFLAARLGQIGQVAAHLLAHGGGAGEVRRRVDGGKLDRAADAQAIVQRRGEKP